MSMNDVERLLSKHNPPNTEFEVRFQKEDKSSLSKSEWDHAVEYAKASYRNPPVVEDTTVYLYPGGVRKIQKGSQTTWEKKVKIQNVDIHPQNIVIRFSLSSETKVPASNQPHKAIRKKHRLSFTSASQKGRHTLDLTEINGGESYEAELEFPGRPSMEYVLDVVDKHKVLFEGAIVEFNNFGYVKYETGQISGTKNDRGYNVLPNFSKPHSYNTRAAFEMCKELYCVTNKLDGVRGFLVFLDRGAFIVNWTHSYILNIPTNPSLKGTILDGELDLNNSTFYIFDGLYLNGQSILDASFLKRWNAVVDWYSKNLSGNTTITLKKYWCTGDMYNDFTAASKYVSENFSADQNDGFIFTPMYKDYNSNISYKWKPIELLTVDFLVVPTEETQIIDDNTLVKVELLSSSGGGRLEKFAETYLLDFEVSEMNGRVVEMKWSSELSSFVPLRIRYDKKVPNGINVAKENMNLIINPIHYDELLQILGKGDCNNPFTDVFWNPKPSPKETVRERPDMKAVVEEIKRDILKNVVGSGIVLVTTVPGIDEKLTDLKTQVITPGKEKFSPEFSTAVILGNIDKFDSDKLFQSFEKGVDEVFGFYINPNILTQNIKRSGPISINKSTEIKLDDAGNPVLVAGAVSKPIVYPTDFLKEFQKRYTTSYRHGVSSRLIGLTDAYVIFAGKLVEDTLTSPSPLPKKSTPSPPPKKTTPPPPPKKTTPLKGKTFPPNERGTMDFSSYRVPFTSSIKGMRYRTLNAIGDGSCFFHSLLYLLDYKDYRNVSLYEKMRIVSELRKDIARTISYEDWINIDMGEYAKVSLLQKLGDDDAEKVFNMTGPLNKERLEAVGISGDILDRLYSDFRKEISMVCKYTGSEVFKFTSMLLKVNIFVVDNENKRVFDHCHYNPSLKKCVVVSYAGAHYEPVVAEKGGWRVLTFSLEDELIRWIRGSCVNVE